MIRNVLTLFKTFVEIILFRKGPDAVPHSSVLFVIVTGIWLFVGAAGAMLVDTYNGPLLLVDLILTIVGFGLYAVLAQVFRKSERLVRALTAILGCGAIFGVVMFGGRYVLTSLLAVEQTGLFAELILLWSILVEGHIIARTIERQWIFGIMAALAVFIIQIKIFAVLKPMLGPGI